LGSLNPISLKKIKINIVTCSILYLLSKKLNDGYNKMNESMIYECFCLKDEIKLGIIVKKGKVKGKNI